MLSQLFEIFRARVSASRVRFRENSGGNCPAVILDATSLLWMDGTHAVLSEVLFDGGGLSAVKPQWVQLRQPVRHWHRNTRHAWRTAGTREPAGCDTIDELELYISNSAPPGAGESATRPRRMPRARGQRFELCSDCGVCRFQ